MSDAQARADVERLFCHLQRRGAVAGEAGPLPKLRREPVPFRGVEFVRAPSAGIVVYREELGAELRAASVVCELVDPAAADPAKGRVAVRCSTDGVFFARRHTMFARPDDVLGKIAGAAEMADPRQY